MKLADILMSITIVTSGIVSIANVSAAESIEITPLVQRNEIVASIFRDALAAIDNRIAAATTPDSQKEFETIKKQLQNLIIRMNDEEFSDRQLENAADMINESIAKANISNVTDDELIRKFLVCFSYIGKELGIRRLVEKDLSSKEEYALNEILGIK